MTKQPGKILYFRKKTSGAQPFMVFVEEGADTYCMPFENLEEALDYMEDKESELSAACRLFQQVLTEDEEGEIQL